MLAAAGLAVSVSAQNTCQQQLSVCQSTQPVNESLCSANFNACLASSSANVPFPTGQSPSVCSQALTLCQNTPPVNQAFCQNNYNACLSGAAVVTAPGAFPTNGYFTTFTVGGQVITEGVDIPEPNAATTFTNGGYTYTTVIPVVNQPTATTCIPATNTVAAAAAATNSCEAIRAQCQAGPNLNESYCASLFYGCLSTASSSLAIVGPTGSVCFAGSVYPTQSIPVATQSNTISYFQGAGAKTDVGTGVTGMVVAAAGFVLALL